MCDKFSNNYFILCHCCGGLHSSNGNLRSEKTKSATLSIGEVPNTYYGLSNKGWIDTALFQDWFSQHFLCYAPPIRPLLLLMDGHSSHYSPEMICIAADEGVILFVLPPNTTNLTQLLDKGVFSALKSNWKHVCHEFITQNPGRVISRYDFSTLFHKAWDLSMTIINIKVGFRITGICPFNSRAITLPGEDKFDGLNRTRWLSKQGSSTFHYTPVVRFVRGQVTKMPMRENNQITVRYIVICEVETILMTVLQRKIHVQMQKNNS